MTRLVNKILMQVFLRIFNYISYVTCTSKASVLRSVFFVYVVILLFYQDFILTDALKFSNDNLQLSSCERCKTVIESFREGLKRTRRGKFEGGDAHWEENKLNNYANSEIRLAEIQESLCLELSSGKDQCHAFAEQYESELEDWFLNARKLEAQNQKEEGSTLFDYLCNEVIKVCCPNGHFGPDCKPCSGYPDNVCNNRGYCSGNGTRQGTGKCVCFQEFDGDTCGKCANNYFASETTEIKIDDGDTFLPKHCYKCDTSCATSCHSTGPKGCNVCRSGYIWDNDIGCIDINECSNMETNPCSESTYCVNTQGSYKCYKCHKTCKSCKSSEPTSCLECADSYEMGFGGRCVAKNYYWNMAIKYSSYIGLCIATFVISRTNFWIGSIVGILAGILVAFVELGSKLKPHDIEYNAF